HGINTDPALQPFRTTWFGVKMLEYHVASDLGGYMALIIVFEPTKRFTVADALAHLRMYGLAHEVRGS
ncbi:MAG: hypothetical protein ACYDBV_15080, partial [Nitrospiria bacterium]